MGFTARGPRGVADFPDGTVFTTGCACAGITGSGGGIGTETGAWLVGTDPITGTDTFRVAAHNWSEISTGADIGLPA